MDLFVKTYDFPNFGIHEPQLYLTAGISSFGDFHLPSQPGTSDSVAPFATWGEAPSKDFLLAPKT